MLISMKADVVQPILHTLETDRVANIEYEYYTSCTFVIGSSESPELFLSSGIPYLYLETFTPKLYVFEFVIDASCTY